jgi:hypothetical protein
MAKFLVMLERNVRTSVLGPMSKEEEFRKNAAESTELARRAMSSDDSARESPIDAARTIRLPRFLNDPSDAKQWRLLAEEMRSNAIAPTRPS